MRICVTGAFGNVGISTVMELLRRGNRVTCFDLPSSKNRRKAGWMCHALEQEDLESMPPRLVWGDIRSYDDVYYAVAGQDAVVHLAAVIPPGADRHPDLAREVNVGGTENIVKTIKSQGERQRLVYSSSIAVYGDRLDRPLILPEDPPSPNEDDEYAKQKLECEGIIGASGIHWTILRLTYIVSTGALRLHPIMFEMPPETSIEICHTADAGLAFANAAERGDLRSRTLLIAGGDGCRTDYRRYLEQMFSIFGLGPYFLPRRAFRRRGYHCGFMDTTVSNRLLGYQRHSLEDFYRETARKYAARRFFIGLVRPLARLVLLRRSRYITRIPLRLMFGSAGG